MSLMRDNDARKLIAEKVGWVKGPLFNYTTFQRLLDEGILPYELRPKWGQAVLKEAEVLKLIAKFPAEEPPRRIGIIGWLKGKRPKKKKAKKGST